MKRRMIMISIILILCFISACSQKENGLESGQEEVELYEQEFRDTSENWEVTLHLIELPVDQIYMEENTFTFKRLKGVDDSIGFNYEMIYGDPVKYSVMLLNKEIITQDEDEYKVKLDQQRLIEEVCFGQFTLKLSWSHNAEELQEESFVFKDHENPQCENVVPTASRNDVK